MDVVTEIMGRRWELTSILLDDRPVEGVEDAGAFLVLGSDLRVQGRGGCNHFFGAYSLEGDILSLGNIASTKMYCHETMHVEDCLLQGLGSDRTVSVQEHTVEMRSGDSSTVLRFEETDGEGRSLPSPAPPRIATKDPHPPNEMISTAIHAIAGDDRESRRPRPFRARSTESDGLISSLRTEPFLDHVNALVKG